MVERRRRLRRCVVSRHGVVSRPLSSDTVAETERCGCTQAGDVVVVVIILQDAVAGPAPHVRGTTHAKGAEV